jgi:hypothetical protein
MMPNLQSTPEIPNAMPCSVEHIHLFGWDALSGTWHGPNELSDASMPDKRFLRSLQAAPGRSWYGPVSCCSPGEAPARFFALVHELSDCAIALLYCDESKAGPAEIVAVIPAVMRPNLREEFALEFLSFIRFLGTLSAEAEFQVHEAIEAAITENTSNTLIFSISSGLWPSDLDPVLSICVEKVAVTLREWLLASHSLK